MSVSRLNFNANTMREAQQYLATRIKQVEHLGVRSNLMFEVKEEGVIRMIANIGDKEYAIYYILEDFRGKGLMTKYLKNERLPILTIQDCGIEDYLSQVVTHGGYRVLSTPHLETAGYKAIQEYYGSDRAERSGVYLMNHIDEGITIMSASGDSAEAIEAYCLHPMFQNDKDLLANLHRTVEFSPHVMTLVMEYRHKANLYLCRPNTDHLTADNLHSVIGDLIPEVRGMLIADKIQNQKDFLQYHYGKHARSDQLNQYFHNWIEYLNPPQEAWDAFL